MHCVLLLCNDYLMKINGALKWNESNAAFVFNTNYNCIDCFVTYAFAEVPHKYQNQSGKSPLSANTRFPINAQTRIAPLNSHSAPYQEKFAFKSMSRTKESSINFIGGSFTRFSLVGFIDIPYCLGLCTHYTWESRANTFSESTSFYWVWKLNARNDTSHHNSDMNRLICTEDCGNGFNWLLFLFSSINYDAFRINVNRPSVWKFELMTNKRNLWLKVTYEMH